MNLNMFLFKNKIYFHIHTYNHILYKITMMPAAKSSHSGVPGS